jgi:hypothetical protein
MNVFTFLWNSLGTALGMLLIAGLFAAPLLLRPVRRTMWTTAWLRKVSIVMTAVLILGLFLGMNYINRQLETLFSVVSNTDHYDYSALVAQAQNCRLDSVTCSLLDKNPPLGTYDTRPWQFQVTGVLLPVVDALFGAVVIWFLTSRLARKADTV